MSFPPRATYRLQLTKEFTFKDAGRLAPYLGRLGVSHAYLSPILKARPGSMHGYDIVDHTVLNPELGTRDDFRAMASAFKENGLGILLDIVPNHMGIGGAENALWLDVLKLGQESRYADWFDIDWTPNEPSLEGRVLVPFLSMTYAEALEQGRLDLRYDGSSHEFAVWAEGAHKLPISPNTYHMIGGEGRTDFFNTAIGRRDLSELISAQHWRPARFSVAADDINYRRFFIVSDLAAIRVEREDVFDHVHKLIFELVDEGCVDGLRVDHVDGLYDPKAYCLRLREKCPRPIYIAVEKILAGHELLRSDWNVDGTTGYEFAGVVSRLLADGHGEERLTSIYERYTGKSSDLGTLEEDAKRNIIDYEMSAELDRLANALRRLASRDLRSTDLTRNALRTALKETVSAMPVYRTYVDGAPVDERDARNINLAVSRARRRSPEIDPAAFDFLELVMTGEFTNGDQAIDEPFARDIAFRIQQFTGPVMAKGLEDTALYQYNRLIALNDVGEKPDRFSSSVSAFHDWCAERRRDFPLGLLATTTHDSKRGEDARARLLVLTSRAEEWDSAIHRWNDVLYNPGELSANDRYYFFQLLLGSWPTTLPHSGSLPASELLAFKERIQTAMLKSVREERTNTNWVVPSADHEAAVKSYVDTVFASDAFLTEFRAFESNISYTGMRNTLIETVLKLTVPGVPDIYQGAELWDQSMVDPDNRRPVNFAQRTASLGTFSSALPDKSDWRSGTIKQWTIAKLLAARREEPELFAFGSYEKVAGERRAEMIFLRKHAERALSVWLAVAGDEPGIGPAEATPGTFAWENVIALPFARVAIGRAS